MLAEAQIQKLTGPEFQRLERGQPPEILPSPNNDQVMPCSTMPRSGHKGQVAGIFRSMNWDEEASRLTGEELCPSITRILGSWGLCVSLSEKAKQAVGLTQLHWNLLCSPIHR